MVLAHVDETGSSDCVRLGDDAKPPPASKANCEPRVTEKHDSRWVGHLALCASGEPWGLVWDKLASEGICNSWSKKKGPYPCHDTISFHQQQDSVCVPRGFQTTTIHGKICNSMSALAHADSQHYHHRGIFPSDKTHRHRQDSLAERDPALVSSIPGNITGASRTQISGSKTPAPASSRCPSIKTHARSRVLVSKPTLKLQPRDITSTKGSLYDFMHRRSLVGHPVSLFFPLVS